MTESNRGEEPMIFYTEYPTSEFQANSDNEALRKTNARVVYRESDTSDGRPFIMLREMGPMIAETLRKEFQVKFPETRYFDGPEYTEWLESRLIALSEEREKEIGGAIGFALRWITRDGAEPTENVMAEHIAQDLTGQCLAAFLESKKENK